MTATPSITPTASNTPTVTPTPTPTEAPPIAVDDTYTNAVGNTLVLVGTTSSFPAVSFTGSVLDNDSDPDNGPSPLSVSAFDTTSTNGGSVSMNADGTFTFVPQAGFTGTDTFTYTITDGVKNATATVHIEFSNVVWYVDNSGSNGSGESNAPFNNLASPQLASHSGDIIFIYQGNSTYSGGISLKNSQQLIGQGVSLVVNGHPLVTGSFALRPNIGNGLGFGVTLAVDNSLRGFNVNAQSGITGTNVGNLTADAVAVTASNGTGVSINGGGTLAVSLDSVSANGMGSVPNGIVLSNTAGSFAVSGGTIQNMAGDGIVLTNASNVSLTSMTVTANAHNGINGTSVSGLSVGSCTIQNNTNGLNQAGLLLTDLSGTNSVTGTEVSGSTENNVTVMNSSGTLTALTFSNCTIKNNNSASGNIGIRVAATNTAVITATIDSCTFSGNRTIALDADAADTSQITFTATNNTITAGTAGNPQGNQGIEVSASGSGQITYDIHDNMVGTPDGVIATPLENTGIDVFAGNTSALAGTVKNNVVINAGTGISGFGIRLFQNSNSTLRANVDGNTVSNVGLDYGILADAAQNTGDSVPAVGQARMDVAVTNNSASVLSGALDAIRVQGRKVNTVCARISGNTTNGGGTGFFGLFARQANTAIFDVEGLALGVQTAAATQSSLGTQNPSAATVGASAATNFTGVAAGSCNIP